MAAALGASDSTGSVYTFGDAVNYGSTPGDVALAEPIVGMAATPMGGGIGWWRRMAGFSRLVMPGFWFDGCGALNRPIVGMAATPIGSGVLVGGVGWRGFHVW